MEFKKLSEIEVGTVTENTHVIAEVDGELKRVPKTEVGGAGGGGLCIKLDESNCIIDEESEFFLTYTGNYDEIIDCLQNGGNISVDMSYMYAMMEGDDSIPVYIMNILAVAVMKEMGAVLMSYDFEMLCTNGSYH